MTLFKPRFNDQCPSHIETSRLIFCVNQLTGFCMRQPLVVKGLNSRKLISECGLGFLGLRFEVEGGGGGKITPTPLSKTR